MTKLAIGPCMASVMVVFTLGCRSAPDGFEGPPTPWESMDRAARHAYMSEVVEPKLEKSFQAHDAERFADFSCGTCHGQGAEDGTYAMPNPELPVINRKTYRQEYAKNAREMVRFMWEHVEIETATLLGKKTGRTRFSCRSCHTRE